MNILGWIVFCLFVAGYLGIIDFQVCADKVGQCQCESCYPTHKVNK